ncbi:acyl-CoA carboxylase subunit beta [Paraconexibacter antarcticus]|uniref:Acyl-CoA carboxylase subunit beta n=1 Tax=Paraconexibacter antarcticus TaxID=2949664 RepID=A0ABY5DW30_9ACTN|nr:acyl-CoA carboxylase subunit beta [Paraconexibacter antarcticus]UTI66231.1 acyl-CoA carboxylase subunit beta [Paraconexibacter antarcticus]
MATEPETLDIPLERELLSRVEAAKAGGAAKYHEAIARQNKMFVRDRVEALLDEGSFVEDGLLARTMDEGLAADAIVTGLGTVDGRPVCVIANDPTVKAGAWGRQTIRKYVRMQEEAARSRCPLVYLVDSAGARLDEQFDLFIDRGHAGRIFWNQCRMSGVTPQICILFGPSPAGAAYVPAFCDAVIMVDGNAAAFLGSPRMVKMAIKEEVTAEEMGGARMHCDVSGLGDQLAKDDAHALELARTYLSYLPQSWEHPVPLTDPVEPPEGPRLNEIIPENQVKPFDMREVLTQLFDEGSIFQHKPRFAKELITAFARLDGRPVGIVASQPNFKGGILTADTSDKGAQFVQMCNAYGIPLIFLSDTPGFMVGSVVERGGIIRHGAKYLSAIANCTVPRISVMLRKSYGAAYMAMSGATFDPDAMIALPSTKMAIMGPEAAVNAIWSNRIEAIEDPEEREAFVNARREEYLVNLDIFRAASEFYVDSVIPGDELRRELILRMRHYANKKRETVPRHNAVIRG